MAWSAPRTWTAGEVPTAAQLNTDLRDNLNELALHNHSGGSGSGTAQLGPVNWVTFIGSAVPAAPGAGTTRVFASSTLMGWINSGGTFFASTSGHEHAIGSGTVSVAGHTSTAATASILLPNVFTVVGSAAASATLLSQAFTFGGAGSRAVVISAQIVAYMTGGGGSDAVNMFVRRDGTVVLDVSQAPLAGVAHLGEFAASSLEYNRPSGSCTYTLHLSLATTTLGTAAIFGRSLHITEVKQS